MIKIGQPEVINYLKGCDKPVTRKQIADGLGWDPIKVSHTLRILLKWGEMDFIEYPGDKVEEMAGYRTGRRTRFFFIVEEEIEE